MFSVSGAKTALKMMQEKRNNEIFTVFFYYSPTYSILCAVFISPIRRLLRVKFSFQNENLMCFYEISEIKFQKYL